MSQWACLGRPKAKDGMNVRANRCAGIIKVNYSSVWRFPYKIEKVLMTQYDDIMNKIAAHFDVEELASPKNQIKELKAKKGF
ncbi:MAG TPA: hypothetical protein VGI82_10830 [Chitinophagaceae bacterium]